MKESDRSEAKPKGHKPNKIWVDKGSKFYKNSFKKWLKDNDIEIYSIHNEGKSVAAERFVRTLKNKIYKYMISVSKNVYIDKLDDIVGVYNNHIIEQLRLNLLMLKIIHILILKIIIKKVKNTVPWTYVINDLKDEEIIGTFYEKELQKTNEKEFRIEKVLKRKGDKLYVKWKGYDNSFNSWIDKKDLV